MLRGILVVAACALGAGVGWVVLRDRVEGSGNRASEEREVGEVTEVVLAGTGDLTVKDMKALADGSYVIAGVFNGQVDFQPKGGMSFLASCCSSRPAGKRSCGASKAMSGQATGGSSGLAGGSSSGTGV